MEVRTGGYHSQVPDRPYQRRHGPGGVSDPLACFVGHPRSRDGIDAAAGIAAGRRFTMVLLAVDQAA